MSNRPDCKFCGFSYTEIKQGREYLYHDEASCELKFLKKQIDMLEDERGIFQKRIDGLEAMLDARLDKQI